MCHRHSPRFVSREVYLTLVMDEQQSDRIGNAPCSKLFLVTHRAPQQLGKQAGKSPAPLRSGGKDQFHPGFRASCVSRRRASAGLPAASFAAPRAPWGPWADLHCLPGNYSRVVGARGVFAGKANLLGTRVIAFAAEFRRGRIDERRDCAWRCLLRFSRGCGSTTNDRCGQDRPGDCCSRHRRCGDDECGTHIMSHRHSPRSLRRGLSDACRAGPADIMFEITKRFGRGHGAPLAMVPLIVGEYGCRYPFNAAQVNLETDLRVEAIARERPRCFRRCSDELRLSIALRETERDAYR
jgi:hypothetical protein